MRWIILAALMVAGCGTSGAQDETIAVYVDGSLPREAALNGLRSWEQAGVFVKLVDYDASEVSFAATGQPCRAENAPTLFDADRHAVFITISCYQASTPEYAISNAFGDFLTDRWRRR